MKTDNKKLKIAIQLDSKLARRNEKGLFCILYKSYSLAHLKYLLALEELTASYKQQ